MPALRIVTLDNFFKLIEDPVAAECFVGMLRMRVRGWGPEYPAHFLPVDTLDFVARHHLFCLQDRDKITPIGGYRSLTLKTSDYHQLTEPHLGFARQSGAPSHVKALEQIFEAQRRQGFDLVSASKVTLDKAYRGDREFSELMRELLAALIYADCRELLNPVVLGSGVFRFKTNLFLERVGFEPLALDGAALPDIAVAAAGNEPILLMRLQKFSAWVEQCHEKHQFLLRSRQIIAPAEPLRRVA